MMATNRLSMNTKPIPPKMYLGVKGVTHTYEVITKSIEEIENTAQRNAAFTT